MAGLASIFSILMVGNSLFGTTGPSMLEQALLAGTGDAQVLAQITPDASLRESWMNSDTAQGVDARSVLPEGGITHLILTEAVPLASHTKDADTEVYAQAFAGLALAANSETHVYVQEAWHSLNSGTAQPVEDDAGSDIPWRVRLDQDLAAWEDIVTKVARGRTAQADRVSLIPAGQAMGRLYDEIAAQQVPGLTDISDLFADDLRLNDMGHYFVTMVQYGVITGLDPLGLPRDFKDAEGKVLDTPDEDLSRALQKIAWDAVRAYEGAVVAPVPPALPVRKTAAPTGPPAVLVAPDDLGPVPELVQVPSGAVEGSTAVAIGLAGVGEASTQMPFLDLMKTAGHWIGNKPGQQGGMTYEDLLAGGYLDAQGWPRQMPKELSSISALILTDMPEAAVSLKGRYRLTFEGKGVIEVTGRAQKVRYGKGQVTFDYTPGPGSVDVRIQRINRTDPPRNIAVVLESNSRRFDRGALFNPLWTSRIGQFQALRFTDWFRTNNSTLSSWADRPKPDDVTYVDGVPIEVMVALANELGIDGWFNVPHLADDDFLRRFAALVRDRLDPELKAYVEFSNEVWNWQYAQARWADAAALERWGQADKWMQFVGLRAAEVARIWTEIFAASAKDRLVNVISSQTSWPGLENDVLTAPLGVAEGETAPVEAFDAYAVSGDFGAVLGAEERADMVQGWLVASKDMAKVEAETKGLEGQVAVDYIAAHRFDHAAKLAQRELSDGAVSGNRSETLKDLLGRLWPYHAQVARAYGLELILSSGGAAVSGQGPSEEDADLSAFFTHLSYSPEMGALYTTLLEGWKAVGGQLFSASIDVAAPSASGNRGALRHLEDSNPRWDALVAFQ